MNNFKHLKTIFTIAIAAMSLSLFAQVESEVRMDGVVLPRMATTAVVGPTQGQMIYATNFNAIRVYNGTSWVAAATSSGGSSEWTNTNVQGIERNVSVGKNSVGIAIGADANTQLRLDAEPGLGAVRFQTEGQTKFRIFENAINSTTMGINWNVPENNALRVGYNRTYIKDSLQIKAPGQNPNVELTRAYGMRMFNTSGTEKARIQSSTGNAQFDGTLNAGASTLGATTTNGDITIKGGDPILNFWNSSPPANGCRIKFDDNASSGGNTGKFQFENLNGGDMEFNFAPSTGGTTITMRMGDDNIWAYEDLAPWTHKTTNLGLNGKAWDNVYHDDLINQGSAAFTDRTLTKELLKYPSVEKTEGMFDYKTERGDIEIDPNFLPPGLSEDNGILIDEMAVYNYKANYEQQVQMEDMKKEIAELKAMIKVLTEK